MPEKKKPSFLKSLRFRILIILVILGIVPSVIVAHVMVELQQSNHLEQLNLHMLVLIALHQ